MRDRRKAPKKGRSAPPKPTPTTRPAAVVTATSVPLEINGWKLYAWPEFRDRWAAMRTSVEAARRRDADGYRASQEAKFFAVIRDLVLREIPSDPAAAHFRQGKTMESHHTHWRRAKFLRRFRLFFRFHTPSKSIIYVWLNDETTLRKASASSDVYRVFAGMLGSGKPPTDWDALVRACEAWPAESAAASPDA